MEKLITFNKDKMITMVLCTCGKARLLAVTEEIDADSSKRITALIKKGCKLKSISLEEARSSELCFEKACLKPKEKTI